MFACVVLWQCTLYNVLYWALRMRSILMLQEKRYKEFLLTKRKVVALCNEMDYDPETSFERDLICEDDEAFQLSVENMESLKTVLHDVWSHFLLVT